MTVNILAHVRDGTQDKFMKLLVQLFCVSVVFPFLTSSPSPGLSGGNAKCAIGGIVICSHCAVYCWLNSFLCWFIVFCSDLMIYFILFYFNFSTQSKFMLVVTVLIQ